jgi:hypothetical protein
MTRDVPLPSSDGVEKYSKTFQNKQKKTNVTLVSWIRWKEIHICQLRLIGLRRLDKPFKRKK